MAHPPSVPQFDMAQLEGEWWKVWNHGWDFWWCHRHVYSRVNNDYNLWNIEVKFLVSSNRSAHGYLERARFAG